MTKAVARSAGLAHFAEFPWGYASLHPRLYGVVRSADIEAINREKSQL